MSEEERLEAICEIDEELSQWVKAQLESGETVNEIIDKLRHAMSVCERP